MDKPRAQFRLRITRGEDIAVGPGKIDLLEAIEATGSITAAARRLGMSYRRAWLLVDTMNRCFKNPVVEAETGGKRGGGTQLTAVGAEAVRRYRRIETLATKASSREMQRLIELMRS
jgi:molybdate transport system regulatory protein